MAKPTKKTSKGKVNGQAGRTKAAKAAHSSENGKQLKAKPASAAVAAKAKVAAMPAAIPVAVPAAAGPANGPAKPVKNQAGLKVKELEFFRDLLIAKRREILGDMNSMEEEALRAGGGSNLSNLPIHMADMGTDNYEQEFTLGLVQKDRDLLHEINVALGKIRDGRYGICEGTGKPISKPRLEAKPWAKFSIEYTRQVEKGGVRR